MYLVKRRIDNKEEKALKDWVCERKGYLVRIRGLEWDDIIGLLSLSEIQGSRIQLRYRNKRRNYNLQELRKSELPKRMIATSYDRSDWMIGRMILDVDDEEVYTLTHHPDIEIRELDQIRNDLMRYVFVYSE